MSPRGTPATPLKRRKAFAALAVAAATAAMLGLSFAAVPLYRFFCSATGFAGTPRIAKTAPLEKGQRTLTVRFDANVAPGLGWKFTPGTPQIKLRTGETATVTFKAANETDRETAGRATFNVTPDRAGAYFSKIACFCFNAQKLGPGESLEMPVVFYLDPELEKDPEMEDVQTITLSYTFFALKSSMAKKRL